MQHHPKVESDKHQSEQGFALPIAVGLGLVMMLVAGILIVRSHDDQLTASAQKAIGSGLDTTEGGLTRVQSFVNNNRYIATYNFSDWTTAASNIPNLSVCGSTTPSQIANFATLASNWQPLDPNDASKGQWKLINYTYAPNDATKPHSTPGVATLEMAGRLVNDNNSADVKVNIPVTPGDTIGIPIPGIWLSQGGTGNNTMQGNVLLNDCSTSPSSVPTTGTDPTTGQPYTAMQTSMQFPPLPTKPSPFLNSLGTLNSSMTLPRSGDTPTTKTISGQSTQVYEYSVSSIQLAQQALLTITPGAKVTFYLDGNINKGGTIAHSCSSAPSGTACSPTDFQIYGYGPSGSQICMNGTGYLETFILAPNYTVGVAGSGNTAGGIKGAVWAGGWSNSSSCGSNTSNTVVIQTANWDAIGLVPQNLPPKLAPVSAWQKQEVH